MADTGHLLKPLGNCKNFSLLGQEQFLLSRILQDDKRPLDLFGNPQNCHSGASRNLAKKATSLDSGFHRKDSFRTSLFS